MRIQFIAMDCLEHPIDIDVTRELTDEEVQMIEDEIYYTRTEYEEGNLEEFDLETVIYKAVEKYVPIAYNPVMRTIYI